MDNRCIRGSINYYSHFYKTQLRPTLTRIDLYVIRWARRKFLGQFRSRFHHPAQLLLSYFSGYFGRSFWPGSERLRDLGEARTGRVRRLRE